MTGVLFACLAGMFLGALNVTLRRGLTRIGDVHAGSAVIAVFAFVLTAVTVVASHRTIDVADVWPFLLLGIFVPGVSQLLMVAAVKAAGASRAGIVFGMAPLFSAFIAIVVFREPLRWPLAAGTLLIVGGGAALLWESERPPDYRAYGPALAVFAAAAFGVRDNIVRTVSEGVPTDAPTQTTALLLGASVTLLANLVRRPSALERLRRAFVPFATSGMLTALAQVTLFQALDLAPVTVVAPLVGTGVLWTIVFAAIFLRRTELLGPRLFVVALVVFAGGALVGATR